MEQRVAYNGLAKVDASEDRELVLPDIELCGYVGDEIPCGSHTRRA